MSEPVNASLRREGLEALRRGDLDAALTALQRSLDAAPDDIETLNLLGIAESQKGNQQRAIQVLDRAIRLSPGTAYLHCNRGLALERHGDRDAARAAFQETLRLEPSHAQARRHLDALNAGAMPAGSGAGRDPNLVAADAAPIPPAARPNIVPCPACGAHTRPGAFCERCNQPLPRELRLPPRDPRAVAVRDAVVGDALGPFTVTAVSPARIEAANVGLAAKVLAGLGLAGILAGGAALGMMAGQGSVPGLLGTAVLPAAGAALLALYARVAPTFIIDGATRRIERRVLFGLSRASWRADRFNAVHFAADLPDRDNREFCWIRFENQQGQVVLQIGPALATDPSAAGMVPLAVQAARLLQIPVQIDGYPRTPSEELKHLLARLG
jgi:tetratricopeptide (TPR) repeat protein